MKMTPPVQIEPQTVDIEGLRINDSLKWSLIIVVFFLAPIFYLLSEDENQNVTFIIPKDSVITIDNKEFQPYPISLTKNESTVQNFKLSLKEGKHTVSIKTPGVSMSTRELFVRKSKHMQVFSIVDGEIIEIKNSSLTDKP